jgi:hypothetical protein
LEPDAVQGGGQRSGLDLDLSVGQRRDITDVVGLSQVVAKGGEVGGVPLFGEGVRRVGPAGCLGSDGGEQFEQVVKAVIGVAASANATSA